ncbi:MAG: hydratase, partial [Aquamicrobium sp.]|nr:hydratase [Aquamicrobium sp.]
MAVSVTGIADAVLAALAQKRQIAPITDGEPDFGLDAAYAVADAVTAARIARGETPAGWKIGFTNRLIWDQYGVHAPIWGPVYDRSVIHAEAGEAGPVVLSAAAFVEPLIEPEIVFRIARPPRSGMDDRALLGCIDAVGHGFEIVQSIYPGWRFRAADTVAAFGMHGALVCGP